MTQIIPSRGGGGGVGLYKYMGTVDYYEDLPTSGMKVGDTYNVVNAHTTAPEFPAGANLAWNGEEWDVLGGTFDLSEYQKKLVEGDGIDIDQDTNEISVESTVIDGAALGATSVQPGDNVSTLNNDAGYITKDVNDLTYYTKTSDLAAVALSNDYDDLDDKPTIGDATITIQKNGTKVDDFGVNDTSNTTVNITMDKSDVGLSNVDNTSDLNKPISTATQSALDLKANSADLATVATTGDYDDLIDKPTIGNATLTIQRNGTNVNTFTANATSNVTANISVPTKTSDITNDSGFIDKDVNNLTNYTLTTSLASVATSGSYNDLSNKPSIPTKTSDLTNDSGFIDKDVNNLTNYTLSSALASVATSGSYNDLSNKPTIGTANLTVQKNGTTVATFGANATSGVTANITVPTKVTDLSDAGDYVKSSSLATVATSGDYDDLTDKPTIPGVVNNVTSTSTTDALAAAQGKALQDQIDDLKALGKFLSLWDCSTGLPISFPEATPYTYSTGDYYLVETVDTTAPIVNYRPNGSSYTGTASTTTESDEVEVGDLYIYDGSAWLLQINHGKTVSFANLAGSPSDNAALSTALGAKQDVSNMVTSLTGADNSHYPTAKAVADALSGAGNGDMLKATYDPNNISADAFDYTNFINTPNLAAVATSGSYNDLSNIPTFAAVATSGSYNDLSNKPTIPTVNNATLTIQKNGTTVKTFTANASTDVTANISVPTKTSDISNDSGYITKSVNNLDNYTLSSALATVATTGSYSDLSNKPTIPTDTSDLTNGAGFITGITSGDVTTALGYTPYNSTNPSGYVTSSIINDTAYGSGWNSDTTHAPTKNAVYDKISAMDTTIAGKADSSSLATVATSGSYTDLSNKPTIPVVDSALSTTSTNALQNKVITDALNGKLDGFTRMFAGNWSGGVHPVRFVRVDYSTANSENGVFIKMSLVNSHGNGQAGRFLEDVILLVTYTGSVECSIYRYFGTQTYTGDYYYNSYGDIFWTIDTTNKIVDFFVLMHQFSYTRMTPYFRLNRSTGGVITQASQGPNNPEYSSGTKSRATIYDYSKIPTKTSQLTNDSGFITSSALSGYQTTSNLKTSLTDNSDTYYPSQKAVKTAVDAKQDTLVSGTNIKTINNTSLLGSGNIDIQSGGNYTAGNGIDITNDEIGLDGTYEWKDYSAMQGPAPSGFHVPLNTERQAVYNIWTALGGGSYDGTNFGIALKLTMAGSRNYDSTINTSSRGNYWSSSPNHDGDAYTLSIRSSSIYTEAYSNRSYGYFVRCFRDSSVVPTNSWTKLYGTSIEAGGIFWSNTDGLISLSSDGSAWITIADKNLGATTVWNSGDTLTDANCGNVFQRGNNYAFPGTLSSTSITTSSTQVNVTGYGPGNYYSSSTWIAKSPRQNSTSNGKNLWGGVTGVQTVSGNLVIGDALYKLVVSSTAPSSGTASNIITISTGSTKGLYVGTTKIA